MSVQVGLDEQAQQEQILKKIPQDFEDEEDEDMDMGEIDENVDKRAQLHDVRQRYQTGEPSARVMQIDQTGAQRH